MNNGKVVIDRSFWDSMAWHKLSVMGRLVILTLFKEAQYEDREVDGIPLKKGEALTSYARLKQQTGATKSEAETALRVGIKYAILKKQIGNTQYSIISINKDFLGFCEDDLRSKPEEHRKQIRRTSEANQNTVISNKEEGIKNNQEKENTYSRIFEHWNTTEIVNHKFLTDSMKTKIAKRLKEGFSEQDILAAIDNYAFVLKSEKHLFSYKWTLELFLGRENGLPMFVNEATPRENGLIGKPKEQPPPVRKTVFDEKIKHYRPGEEPANGGLISGCPFCHGSGKISMLGGPDQQCKCKATTFLS